MWSIFGRAASQSRSRSAAIAGPLVEDETASWRAIGQATMSMMLVAADLGIGTGHLAVGDQDLARHVLGLPAERLCAYLISMGYPADRPLRPISRPHRRPLADVVHRGRWRG
ncbi:MAG TPA: nitroreductase family protein [Micromonosporaceae bacterium]|jgi:nitroreductase|nr:nitroreductase family protein [Micromonosporaceae bacterium]